MSLGTVYGIFCVWSWPYKTLAYVIDMLLEVCSINLLGSVIFNDGVTAPCGLLTVIKLQNHRKAKPLTSRVKMKYLHSCSAVMWLMQAKLSELERKYDMQVARHEQLTREMNQLRQLAPGSSSASQQHPSPSLPIPATGSTTSEHAAAASGRVATSAARTTGSAAGDRHRFDVYVAKYSYDPVQYSPNDNPEAELKLNAGDYIFIYGHVDEVSRQWRQCKHWKIDLSNASLLVQLID